MRVKPEISAVELSSEMKRVRSKLRQYREKIPLLFSDNLLIEHQMLLHREVDEESGVFQLSESRFHKTQNRREKMFLNIYKAIEKDLDMGEWNSKAYGELKSSIEIYLLASLLNIQANSLDGITPGMSPDDQCKYISEHVTEKFDSIEDCAYRLGQLINTNQFEEYFAEDTETPKDGLFSRALFTPNLKILTLPLPEISESSPAFGIEVKLALIETGSEVQIREKYAKKASLFKVFVGAAENCLQDNPMDFLTDFVRPDDNYYKEYNNAYVSMTARYDLKQCQGSY